MRNKAYKSVMKKAIFILMAALAVAACREDELVIPSDTQDTGGSSVGGSIV